MYGKVFFKCKSPTPTTTFTYVYQQHIIKTLTWFDQILTRLTAKYVLILYLSVDKNHYMKWLTATLDYMEFPGR